MVSALALWWGWNAIKMLGCGSVSFSGGRVVNVVCYESGPGYTGGAVSGTVAGLGILLAAVGVLFWMWVLPILQYRSSLASISTEAHQLALLTGLPADVVQNDIVQRGVTPREWALAHDIDPTALR